MVDVLGMHQAERMLLSEAEGHASINIKNHGNEFIINVDSNRYGRREFRNHDLFCCAWDASTFISEIKGG